VDLRKLHEVITHSTGDCNAMRTRIPFEGVLPDGPASNDWQPGFMTDLMAKDLDIAIEFAARADTPLFTSGIVRQLLSAASVAGRPVSPSELSPRRSGQGRPERLSAFQVESLVKVDAGSKA